MEFIVNSINSIVWSGSLIYLCLGSGIFFSIATRFPQLRLFREMLRLLFDGKESAHGVSSFQALSIAISGRVGTGNIAGVATAIALGGPGAIFWMWVIAFLGSASAYVEATLGQIYKEVRGGEYRGGPTYYIEKGLRMPRYAMVFAFTTIVAMAIFLPGVQANGIASSVESAFEIPKWATGGVICVLLGMVVFGGVRRIGHVAQVVVPFMATAYILVSLVVIALNIERVPEVFMLIVRSAMGAEQAFAGVIGLAISWGVKRGIYSNEAGQGTAPHAASAAEVSHPAKQGLVQAFSVYIDTLFVCSATAFMILFTNSYNVEDPNNPGAFLVENLPGAEIGPAYTQAAISSEFAGWGAPFIAITLTFFAFTTLMAYYYIAETNVAYLDKRGDRRWMIGLLRVVILGASFYGAISSAGFVWTLGDIGVGLMAWLNILAIIMLRKPALKALRDYCDQRADGMDPTFNPVELGIEGADFWEAKYASDAATSTHDDEGRTTP